MSLGKIGRGYFLIDGEKIPAFVTEISASFGKTIEFRGHFCDVEYARGGVIPVGKSPIKNVIFNDPATVVMWEDGTKTVVKCQPGDTYSKETGLALCIAKKYLGNKGNFNEVFKKWIPEEAEPVEKVDGISVEKMRAALYEHCNGKWCGDCPINKDIPDHRCGRGASYNPLNTGSLVISDDEIRAAYKVVFCKEG